MDTHFYIPVTAAVIEKDEKILIAKRKKAYMGYLWEFPGGKQKEGETLEDCLKREIKEELGIDIAVGSFICSVKHILNCQSAIELHAFMAIPLTFEFHLKDHEEVRWVGLKELPAYSFFEPDRIIVRQLMESCPQYHKED
ncbi:MAG TPA: (deoxy)nucleoside triphosphate pyrophosphohydrolase [Syntrophorhabdaceae bacterium]|nr:(deoxy)nucleoside triphosphate pyrophosphohydrolase [Syntrophorhabdaceae bacterium]HQE81307.1 (deoxy)nucleoside triphosphate pyrophosphohydrolase [Syntrophorhabdaceae bacterium]